MRLLSVLVFSVVLFGNALASPLSLPRRDGLAPLITPRAIQGLDSDAAALQRRSIDVEAALPFDFARQTLTVAGLDTHLVPDSYIVVFNKHTHPDHVHRHKNKIAKLHADEMHIQGGPNAESLFSRLEGFVHDFDLSDSFRGYSGRFSKRVLDEIRADPDVAYVERDSFVWANDEQRGAPWGLARISHRDPLSFKTFNKYDFDSNAGEGVDVYVIDTGVNIDHDELEGRAHWGKSIGLPDEDDNGHGSHVAGTIASRKYGVAKKANVFAVKVLAGNGSGTTSGVIGGISWSVRDHQQKRRAGTAGSKGAVANMSIGGGKSFALDDAVEGAVTAGIHFAVAAGNENQDACNTSPAGASAPITVGASTLQDDRAYFSNWGKCVDIFAPGLNILSIWNEGPSSVKTISGTSMASPHIAGLAAYFLSLYPENFRPTAADYIAAGEAVPEDPALFALDESAVFGPLSLAGDVGSIVETIIERKYEINGLFETGKQLVFERFRKFTTYIGGKPAGSPHVAELKPSVLKAAMVRLATKGALSDLPEKTVNLLAFNNFTSSDY